MESAGGAMSMAEAMFFHISQINLWPLNGIKHETEGLQKLHDFTWGCSWGYFSGHTNNIL